MDLRVRNLISFVCVVSSTGSVSICSVGIGETKAESAQNQRESDDFTNLIYSINYPWNYPKRRMHSASLNLYQGDLGVGTIRNA
jgi:hypothetical protein